MTLELSTARYAVITQKRENIVEKRMKLAKVKDECCRRRGVPNAERREKCEMKVQMKMDELIEESGKGVVARSQKETVDTHCAQSPRPGSG